VRAVVLGEQREAIFAAEEGGGSRPCGGVVDVHLADSESLESARCVCVCLCVCVCE
jgi:hypothetical protein